MKKGSTVLIALILLLGALTDTYAADISLSPGWNLVSLPLQPANTAIASVLSGISGSYELVWGYSNQIWSYYDPNDIGNSMLQTMETGNGYWIEMTGAETPSISGTPPASPLSLLKGWNLVGYDGASCAAPSSAFSSLGGSLEVSWGYASQSWKVYDPNDAQGSTMIELCVTINGSDNTINAPVGSVVRVPSTATGPANNIVSTGA